jgi:type IV pilus assembly protein PilX
MNHASLRPSFAPPRRQAGAVLIVGLIFLALLTMIGTTAFIMAKQNERMSGNTRDLIRAFGAAEASLRDCESVLSSSAGLPAFTSAGVAGMHLAAAYDAPQVYEAFVPSMGGTAWSTTPTQTRPLAAPLVDVALPPFCIIERLGDILVTVQGGAISMGQKKEPQTVYRITAVGFGANQTTTASVQSTYRRP